MAMHAYGMAPYIECVCRIVFNTEHIWTQVLLDMLLDESSTIVHYIQVLSVLLLHECTPPQVLAELIAVHGGHDTPPLRRPCTPRPLDAVSIASVTWSAARASMTMTSASYCVGTQIDI